jgi:hypothetical protein
VSSANERRNVTVTTSALAALNDSHISCVTHACSQRPRLRRRPQLVLAPIPTMISLLPLTLVSLLLGPFFHAQLAHAGSANFGDPCSVNNQRLQIGTYQFSGDCNSVTFCNSSGLCDHKGCRRDEFPFGYSNPQDIPDRCSSGMFCPDEEDACQPLLAVGSPCQFNRDGKVLKTPEA